MPGTHERPAGDVKVGLAQFDEPDQLINAGETKTQHHASRTLLHDIDREVTTPGIARIRKRLRINLREKPQITHPCLTAPHLDAIPLIPRINLKFAPNHLVARPVVPANQHIPYMRQLTLDDPVFHVHEIPINIRLHHRDGANINVSATAVVIAQAPAVRLYNGQRRYLPGGDRDESLDFLLRKQRHTGNLRLAEAILRPLDDCDVQRIMLIRVPDHQWRLNLDIQKALRGVDLRNCVANDLKAIRVDMDTLVPTERVVPFIGAYNAAQIPIGDIRVAPDANPAKSRTVTLIDRHDDPHAVRTILIFLHDPRDPRRGIEMLSIMIEHLLATHSQRPIVYKITPVQIKQIQHAAFRRTFDT